MENKEQLTKLVEAFRDGDTEAFSQIYEMTNQNLYLYARFLMKDEDRAQDLLQDTYIEILRSIGNIKDPGAFITWSKKIMLNCSRQKFRKESKEVTPEDEKAAEMFDELADKDNTFQPEMTMDDSETRRALMEIIEELPPHHRMALVSFYVDDMPIKEIAEMMDIPVATVKSRLFYARSSFKSKVDQYEARYGVKLHALMPAAGLLKSLRFAAGDPAFQLGAAASKSILSSVGAATGLNLAVDAANSAASAGSAASAAGAAGGSSGTASAGTGAGAAGTAGGSAGSAGSAGAVGAAGTAGAAGTSGMAAGGLLAKLATTSIGTKIIAGTVAVGVAIGGGGAYVHHSNVEKEQARKLSDAYEAYYEEILDNEDVLPSEDWQARFVEGDYRDEGNYQRTNKPVALCDITGDGVPELFQFQKMDDMDGVFEMHVYTYNDKNKKLDELKYDWTGMYSEEEERLEVPDSGPDTSGSQIVFRDKDGDLCIYTFFEADSGYSQEGKVRKYRNEGDTLKIEKTTEFALDYISEDNYAFSINGKTLPQKDAYKQMRDLLGNMDSLIMYSDFGYDFEAFGVKNIKDSDALQMSVSDMLVYLQDHMIDDSDGDHGELPAAVEDSKFYFSSGAGGWGTELSLNRDGTFSGEYVDNDLGDTGDEYPRGTVYKCEFTGEFDKIRKTGDHEYTLHLKSIKYKRKPDTSEIKNNTRYEYRTPFGLEKGKEYKLYTPGKTTDDLNGELLGWLMYAPGSTGTGDAPEKLSVYVLHNVEMNYGFYQEK